MRDRKARFMVRVGWHAGRQRLGLKRNDIRMDDLDEADWADWLRVMTVLCVRNTRLEDIHAGKAPVTKIGDFSDVIVVDADGRRIPWPEVSHFGDETMKELMRDIVNRLYTFHAKAGEPEFDYIFERWLPVARRWDFPTLAKGFLTTSESRDSRGKGASGFVASKCGKP